MRSVTMTCCLLLSAALSLVAHAEGAKYYRYFDSQGHTIINDSIPPDKVAGGYDILNAQGRVIASVAGVGSAEEQQLRRIQLEQDNYDRTLLRRYSSTVDVTAARDRYLRELTIRIETLKSSLLSSQEKLQEAAKALETLSTADTQHALYSKNAQFLKDDIHVIEQQIVEREQEYKDSVKRFTKELARLKELKAAEAAQQGLSEYRR